MDEVPEAKKLKNSKGKSKRGSSKTRYATSGKHEGQVRKTNNFVKKKVN